MNKTEQEYNLLVEACQWFKEKYGKFPEECNVKFTRVWYKPFEWHSLFSRKPVVVFAPTKEIGESFIKEQNIILRIMECFVLAPVIMIASIFAFAYSIQHGNTACTIAVVAIVSLLWIGAFFLVSYLGIVCKKFEKIHEWNVDVYYPED